MIAPFAAPWRSILSELIAELNRTPLSVLLVVAGLMFLMLSVVSRLGALVVVSPARQTAAAALGIALLLAGVALDSTARRPDVHPSATSDGDAAGLSPEILTGRRWMFLHGAGDVIAAEVRLDPTGGIEGIDHPNERRWTIEEGALVFLHESGEPSTRFTEARVENGRMVLTGRLLLAPPGETVIHVLREK
jgi:hypothetical protein